MAEKKLNVRLINKHDVEANWLKATNFIPKQAEIIVYDIDENYDYQRFKIGDGETLVNELPFANDNNALSVDEIDEICGTMMLGSTDEFIDKATGVSYRLYVENGRLNMEEVQ